MPRDREANKASQRAWYQRNKERVKAKSRAYYAEKKHDPDWYAKHLERSRIENLPPEGVDRRRARAKAYYHQQKADKRESDT